MEYVDSMFEQMAQEYPNVSFFDVRSAPRYTADVPGNGLFGQDVIHFTADVNKWVAAHILQEYIRASGEIG